MSGTLVAIPMSGDVTVWRLVEAGAPPRHVPRRRWLPAGVFGLGLLASAGAAVATWHFAHPDTIVRTRIVADGAGAVIGAIAGRAALSDLALRFSATPKLSARLQDGGAALVVTAQDPDPAVAHERSQSLVDAILAAPIVTAAGPGPAPADVAGDSLHLERTRLATAADAVEARAAAISASLTALTRDMASAARNADDHKPGRETLDKGNAALADLELQRLQLVSKYQDTYPAVVALDGQIRNLRVFLIDEAHRIDAKPTNPGQTDSLLAGERDRLLAELSQLGDRRRAVATDLATVDRTLAALPAVVVAATAVMAPPPVLVASATTSFAGADNRPFTVTAIVVIGLVLSALAWVLARRRPIAFPHRLMLEPVGGGLLGAGTRALPVSLHAPLADAPYPGRWTGPAPADVTEIVVRPCVIHP